MNAAITAAPRPPFSPRSSSSTRPGNSEESALTASPVPSGLPSSATHTSIPSPWARISRTSGPTFSRSLYVGTTTSTFTARHHPVQTSREWYRES